MNLQQAVQPRPSSNGFGRRRVDREASVRTERAVNGVKIGGTGSPSRDRLVYILSYLVGQVVEVQVKNGSIISGIFHGATFSKDFELVLKMAQVIKDGSVKGQKSVSDIVKKPRTMVIPAREFVQVLAKDVILSTDELTSAHANEKRKDLMIDSVISHSHHLEIGRELEPWMPDENDPEYPDLESTFDRPWNRNWNQFEANETLFGVTSTFDEDLYTTKLERGPQMREREREALRIAMEIEGEGTLDPHLAEERGICLNHDLDLDEESRYSAVLREINNGRPETATSYLDACTSKTFGGSLSSGTANFFGDNSSGKDNNELPTSSALVSSVDDEVALQTSDKKAFLSGSSDQLNVVESDYILKGARPAENKSSNVHSLEEAKIKDQDDENSIASETSERIVFQEDKTLKLEDPVVRGRLIAPKETSNPSIRPGSSVSSTPKCAGVSSGVSGPGLSPSSSVGSFSSEKSTLNPNAKEFKLNPNAKSFTPSTSFRPPTPISDGSLFYPNNVSAVQHMHGVPVGMGIAPSFGSPVVYSPQAAPMQSSQTYIHPSGSMYGQQMILGQARPLYIMPSYPPEMPYKGRNFQ